MKKITAIDEIIAGLMDGALDASSHVVKKAEKKISQEDLDVAHCAVKAAIGHGRDWAWSAAEKSLDDAYAALGGENVGSGYEWHCGTHPAQLAREATVARLRHLA